MTTSPDSSAADNAATNGDAHRESVDVQIGSTERRRRPPPRTPEAYLHELPASVLLDRLPIPMLAVRLDGVVIYTNPAFATMLGHQHHAIALIGQSLPTLLAGYSATPPLDCLTALCTAHNHNVVVDWLHAEGFPVRSVISESVFVRTIDQILLMAVTDITELIWATHPEPH